MAKDGVWGRSGEKIKSMVFQYIKIFTKFIDGLDELESWPNKVKTMQKN